MKITTTIKAFLSFLLVFEPVAFYVLKDNGGYGICRSLLANSICESEYRFAFMLVPVILMILYLMWEKQIISLFKVKKQPSKQKTVIKQRPVIKQRFIAPLEAMGRFWMLADNLDTAQRSEYWGAIIPYAILLCILGMALGEAVSAPGILPLLLFIQLILVFPATTLGVRRWHDIGMPGYIAVAITLLCLLLFLCVIISDEEMLLNIFAITLGLAIIQFIAFLFPSKLHNNKYRSNAKDELERNISLADLLDDDEI